MPKHKHASVVGALIALFAFATVALRPSLAFGRYAGELLAGGIFNVPLRGTLIERLVVHFGSILGLVATASFFLVVGAVLGALFKSVVLRLAGGEAPGAGGHGPSKV